jgi:hypothetical protein
MKNAAFCDVTPCDHYKNDVSEELIASFISVKRTSELEILVVTTDAQSEFTSYFFAACDGC